MPTPGKPIRTALIVSDLGHELAGRLERRHPDLEVRYVERAADLKASLAGSDFDAVFSIKLTQPAYVDQQIILQHGSVRFFQVGGSGYEHLGSWDPARVTVANCAGVLAPYLAETVTGAMLALNGNFPRYLAQQREHKWEQRAFRPLAGQTLLVVGLGAIGGHVAANARALGMRVLAVNRSAKSHSAVERAYGFDQIDTALPLADVVSLHLRLTPETRGLLDARRLGLMKPGAMLINTSRGAVVDERALIAALQQGLIGSAYLDVFAVEPLPRESPLWAMANVMLTPHASDNAIGWSAMFLDVFAGNIERWNRGEPLVNVVRP